MRVTAGSLRSIDQWPAGKRAGVLTALVGALLIVTAIVHVLSPWVRAVALFSDVIVLDSRVRPLTWVTGEPTRQRLEWDNGWGELTLPAGRGEAPALVLALGARPAGPDDYRVMRVTEALARVGFAVLLPQSEALHRGEVAPGEVDYLVDATLALLDHPRSRDERAMIVGLSVGGSLALLAAGDERIAGRLASVLAFGAYARAADIVAAAAAQRVRGVDGSQRPWLPNRTTEWVLLASLRAVPASAGADAEAAREQLLDAIEQRMPLSLDAAEEAVGRLDASQQEWLDRISPAGRLHRVQATWMVIHDYGDDLIPYEESDRLAAERRPDRDLRIDLFDHVTPDASDLGIVLRDGARLIRVFSALIATTR